MIFISYNHLDEVIVDTIVRRLEIEFGRRNIFYDKWSICPGDSIIGKMNEGSKQFAKQYGHEGMAECVNENNKE